MKYAPAAFSYTAVAFRISEWKSLEYQDVSCELCALN